MVLHFALLVFITSCVKVITFRVVITSCVNGITSRGDYYILRQYYILRRNRRSEYISELYHDERGNKPPIMKNFDGPPIMKDEIRKDVKSMKNGKAAGPDKINVEMIESLDEFGIDMLTDFLNAIYDSGEIPSDLSKSICIALPKKPGATECESHRTISLMSHITKILLKILMARMRNKITPEIAEEHYVNS